MLPEDSAAHPTNPAPNAPASKANPSPDNVTLQTIWSRGALAAHGQTKRDEGVAAPGEMLADIDDRATMGRTSLWGVKWSFAKSPNRNFACAVFSGAIACLIQQPAANAETPVSNRYRLPSWTWVAIPLSACGFLIGIDAVRVRHIDFVSENAEWATAETATGATALAAHAGWEPRLIVPEHNNASYEWLDQTRQMFARREWRVRHVDYENAPFGRDVSAASPYRWWLGLLAWCDQQISARPLGQAVEWAALVADPLLHLLLLGGTVIFVMRRFGAYPAALLSIGLVVLFPLATEFLPGIPEDRGLAQICAIWSLLPLLAGAGAANATAADAGGRARRWFLVAGFIGGLGLWISVSHEVPVLVGIALGGLIAAWVNRSDAKTNPAGARGTLPWGAWALGGAATSLGVYLIEYFPAHLGSWQLRVNHPIYGLAWLGGGALLAWTVAWIERGRPSWSLRGMVVLVLAVGALAVVPVVMWRTGGWGFLEVGLPSFRLARLPGGATATSLMAWLDREENTMRVWTTLLPVSLVLPAVGLILRRRTEISFRAPLALALGPVLVALGFACWQLSWWNGLDGVLLVLMAATTAAWWGTINFRFAGRVWAGFVVLVLLPGALQVFPRGESGMGNTPGASEVLGLIERDLARWLATRAASADAVVLAPHNEAVTLHYYGGLRGLATLGWENQAGLEAAVRIVSASTPEEAKELIDRRTITHIVIPSWDSYLDVYARMGMGQLDGTFLKTLHDWNLPLWLRPVPYQLPTIAGFEGQSVAILEVVEEQDNAAALSRIAEYFVEMGQLDLAASAGQALRRYPADLGALVARGQVETARGNATDFARTVELLKSRLSSGADRGLLWDRRVSLAVVLARARQMDLAREQVRRCLAEVDEAKLRWLTTGSLYRLQVLGKAFGLAIADQRLHELALDLLPPELRARL